MTVEIDNDVITECSAVVFNGIRLRILASCNGMLDRWDVAVTPARRLAAAPCRN